MNLMLTASCNDADDFRINGYEKVKKNKLMLQNVTL